MVTLEITFPANRYHATAWGTHVNEGIIEWPPSPWRLLRALIAAWHWKEETRADISEPTLESLVGKLSETLPVYKIPDAWPGHTRHYLTTVSGKKEGSTKVFDAFLHVGKEARLLAQWDCDLSAEELTAMQTLSSKWSYLGRAESLVEAKVIENTDLIAANALPIDSSNTGDQSPKKILQLLTPVPTGEFQSEMEKLNSNNTPSNLMAALRLDTADFKKQGWSQPPGSRWERYLVPDEPPKSLPNVNIEKHNATKPTVARFAVVSDVSPSITQALSIGERVHATLVKCSDSESIFTGIDQLTGKPLSGHQHAHIFPETTNHRGTVNYLSVFAPSGFEPQHRKALEALRKTWGYGGHDLQMILLGVGQPEDFAGTNRDAGQSGIFSTSRRWQSLTPFVPTRHPKYKRNGDPKMDPNRPELQIGSPMQDLTRLLELRGLPHFSVLETGSKIVMAGAARQIPCLKFQRIRKTGGGRSNSNHRGYSFRLEFEKPVCGPVCAGYGSHFGLGLFAPVPD